MILGAPSDQMQAMFQEQQRVAMIENYRQSAALQIMLALTVAAAKDTDDISEVCLAKAAKRAKIGADKLVNEVFPQE